MKTEKTLSDETFKDGIQKVADLGPRRPALSLASPTCSDEEAPHKLP